MSYFKNFPTTEFNQQTVKDIIRRVVYNVSAESTIFDYIILQDNQKPEDISYKYYGVSYYHWVIMIVNDVIHPFYDWLMNEDELREHITNVYGEGHENDVHHYETTSDAAPEYVIGTWVDVNFASALRTAVTNTEYETEKNEEKRTIRILKPKYLAQIESELKQKIRNVS